MLGIQDHRFNRNILVSIVPHPARREEMLLASPVEMVQNRHRTFVFRETCP